MSETDSVEVTANSARRSETPVVRSLAAGESVTERYVVQGNRLSDSGTYRLDGYFEDILFSYSTGDRSGPNFVLKFR